MAHLDNAFCANPPARATDYVTAELNRMYLGVCADLSITSLLAAVEVKLSAMSVEGDLPWDWHNTAMSLKNAAGFLYGAAEHIASGDHAAGRETLSLTPEQGVQFALSCIHRVFDGQKVRPVEPLPF